MSESNPPRNNLPEPAGGWSRAYIDATSDALLALDLSSGLFVDANPAALRLLGYAPGALTGAHFSQILPPNTASPSTPISRRFPVTGELVESQQFQRADGLEIACDISVTPLPPPADGLAVINLRDARAREALLRSRIDADHAAVDTAKSEDVIRGIEQYMSHVSHELRTPLAVILSSSNMLERYYSRLDESKREEHFSRIQEQVKYLTEYLENLRFLSRLNAGQISASPDVADLASLIQDLLGEFASNPLQPSFDLSVDGNISAVRLDVALWRRALFPVIQNAVKYGPFAATVHIAIVYRPGALAITVTDHGPGLPADYLPVAFETFRRGENARETHGGGIGLAIASRCAALMGGTLTFETRSGAGSSFTLSLPA